MKINYIFKSFFFFNIALETLEITPKSSRSSMTSHKSHPYNVMTSTSCYSWQQKPSSVFYDCHIPLAPHSSPINISHPSLTYGLLYDVTTQWGVPSTTTELVLNRQGISQVEVDAFQTGPQSLVTLDLAHNTISYVAVGAFRGLELLQNLDMSFNKLQILPSCSFVTLTRLQTLLLRSNELVSIQRDLLVGLTSLTLIDVSSNHLTDLAPDVFRVMTASQSIAINVRHNRLINPDVGWLSLEISSNLQHSCGSGEITGCENCTRHQLPVHLLWSEGNPWCCSCHLLARFITRLHDLESGGACWNSANCSILRDSSGSCVRGITLPCSYPSRFIGINLASAPQVVNSFWSICCDSTDNIGSVCLPGGVWSNFSRSSSCQFVQNWKKNTTRSCKLNERYKNAEKSFDNRATLIGIFIVIAIPVLLTLLPSCDREDKRTEHLLSGASMIGVTIAHHTVSNNSSTNVPASGDANIE